MEFLAQLLVCHVHETGHHLPYILEHLPPRMMASLLGEES